LVIALSILTYGLFNIAPVEFNVLHDRQPLFVQLSDGSIRNKYEIKLLNKTHKDQIVSINFESKIKNLKSQNALQSIPLKNGVPKSVFVYLSAFEKDIGNEQEVTFIIEGEGISKKYTSSFFSP
jgi:polyferredoxin